MHTTTDCARIEISSKLQMITNAYTDDIRATNSMLYIALSVISCSCSEWDLAVCSSAKRTNF